MACKEWASALVFFNQIFGCAALFRLFEACFRHFSPPLFFTVSANFSNPPQKSFSQLPGGNSANGNHFMELPGGGLTNGNHFMELPGGGLTNGNHFMELPGGNLTNGNHFAQLPHGDNKKHKNIPVCCSGLFGGTSPPLLLPRAMGLSFRRCHSHPQ